MLVYKEHVLCTATFQFFIHHSLHKQKTLLIGLPPTPHFFRVFSCYFKLDEGIE